VTLLAKKVGRCDAEQAGAENHHMHGNDSKEADGTHLAVRSLPLPLSLIPERFTPRPSLVLAPSVHHKYDDSPDGYLG
jgi:hypothetical protein